MEVRGAHWSPVGKGTLIGHWTWGYLLPQPQGKLVGGTGFALVPEGQGTTTRRRAFPMRAVFLEEVIHLNSWTSRSSEKIYACLPEHHFFVGAHCLLKAPSLH